MKLYLMHRYVWSFALLAYCALIYYLSDQSTLPIPFVFNMQDKLIHASAYAGMAFLCWQAGKAWMQMMGSSKWTVLAIVCVLFSSLYGVTDEFHQSFIPGRDASVYDWLADSIGALLLTMLLRKREFSLLD